MKHALLIVTAVAFAAAAGGCAWLMSRYAPGYSVAEMVMNADVIAKLVIKLVLLLTFGALLLGVIGLFARGAAAPVRMLLMLTAAASAGLGLFAALYGWMNIQTAVRAIGPVSFAAIAPSRAETLLVLSFGLFGAIVALGLRALIGRRGRA
jgi:hypothetical protein